MHFSDDVLLFSQFAEMCFEVREARDHGRGCRGQMSRYISPDATRPVKMGSLTRPVAQNVTEHVLLLKSVLSMLLSMRSRIASSWNH